MRGGGGNLRGFIRSGIARIYRANLVLLKSSPAEKRGKGEGRGGDGAGGGERGRGWGRGSRVRHEQLEMPRFVKR